VKHLLVRSRQSPLKAASVRHDSSKAKLGQRHSQCQQRLLQSRPLNHDIPACTSEGLHGSWILKVKEKEESKSLWEVCRQRSFSDEESTILAALHKRDDPLRNNIFTFRFSWGFFFFSKLYRLTIVSTASSMAMLDVKVLSLGLFNVGRQTKHAFRIYCS
jgi:hypothetical protein